MKYSLRFSIRNFFLREISFLGRQRFMTLLFYEAVLTVGLSFKLFGLTGITKPWFFTINALFLGVVLILFLLYILRAIPLKACLYATTIVSHAFLSLETIIFISDGSDATDHLALANIVLLSLNSLYSTMAYLKWNSYLLGFLTVATCAISMYQIHSSSLREYLLLIIITFVMSFFCSERLVANTTLLNSENVKFKREEQELHFLFRMKREQMRSYILLGKKTYPSSVVEKLVNDLDPETARNLIINMHAYTTEAKSVLRRLRKNLPELTLSERDICLLIIQGKKQGEICRLLNKSKSNINTQRVNIRKKLMLKPEENLYESLKRAVESHCKQTQS